ncbi:hypothetical protein R84981_002837 [Carnimonas sp. R-84981]|uniref:phage holin n=1 Tax=Carnimonas bestiolae TaxID=3402172 RepID=UPI003EDC077F
MIVMPHKASTAASYCTSGVLACGGILSNVFHTVEQYIDWGTVSAIAGILIGLATFWVNKRNQRKRTQAYIDALQKGVITPPK